MAYSAEAVQFHSLIHPHQGDLQLVAHKVSVPIELKAEIERNTDSPINESIKHFSEESIS